MLVALTIRDIVVIDRLEIGFEPGMTVLTGETGAGKSILLDSLSLALGARGDAGMVRTGADQGDVAAVFSLPAGHPVLVMLEERGLSAEGEVILRRVQTADGRSRAFINDEPVSVGFLREVGARLVEIHGQHDDRAMIDAALHRALLDAYGGLGAEAETVAGACAVWRGLREELDKARRRIETARADADYLRAAVEELTQLAPEPGEEAALAEVRQRMMGAEKVATDISEAHEAIAGGASPMPVLASLIRRLERKAADAGGILDSAIRALDGALTSLQEAETALAAALEDARFDPQELERSEERLFALRAAGRKYAVPVDDLPDIARRMSAELAELDSGEERVHELEAEAEAALVAYRTAAASLSSSRKKAGASLARAVAAELPDLKLEGARFMVEVDTDPERVSETGADTISFLVQTNPGTQPGPLMKVASGGELSRFLLALKVALADRGSAPTLVFDEIDTAVGGAVADAIGLRLARLAGKVQVMSVTHAPQVAARAGSHLLVSKAAVRRGKAVATEVAPLSDDMRREEIARMLAGATVTDEARAAADRLILGAV